MKDSDRDQNNHNNSERQSTGITPGIPPSIDVSRVAQELQQYLQSRGVGLRELQSFLSAGNQPSIPNAATTTNAQPPLHQAVENAGFVQSVNNQQNLQPQQPAQPLNLDSVSSLFRGLNQLSMVLYNQTNIARDENIVSTTTTTTESQNVPTGYAASSETKSNNSQEDDGARDSLGGLLPDGDSDNLGKRISEGATVVPCRARGISKDHNAKTAYFIIPEGIKHGDGLLCSHITCQNKGIRFVYCRICDQPVAKINFSTRHKHLDVIKSEGKKRKKGDKRTSDVIGYDSSSGSSRQSEDDQEDGENPQKIQRTASHSSKSVSVSYHSSSGSTWDEGDEKKPTNPRSASISSTPESSGSKKEKSPNDPEKNSSSSAGITTSSNSREAAASNIKKEWFELLKERPKTKRRKEMKAWLERVLFTSEYMVSGVSGGSTSSSDETQSSESSNKGHNSNENFSGLIAEGLNTLDAVNRNISKISATLQEEPPVGTTTQRLKSENSHHRDDCSEHSDEESDNKSAQGVSVSEKPANETAVSSKAATTKGKGSKHGEKSGKNHR